MKIYAYLILLLAAVPIQAELTREDRGAIWSTVWSEIGDRFAGFDSVGFVKWEQCFDSVLVTLAAEPNDVEFWRSLRRHVASLQDGQTEIVLPDDLPRYYDTVPIRCAFAGDAVVVDRLSSSPEVVASQIDVGDELLSIDGVSAAEKINADCLPHISGAHWEAKQAKAVWRVLTGESGSTANLRFRKPDGREYERSLRRDTGPDSRFYHELFAETDDRFRFLDEQLLYVTIGSSLTRQVQYTILEYLNENQNLAGLIIDLRETRSGDVLNELIADLVPFAVPRGPFRERNPEAELSWEVIPEEWIAAADQPFLGKFAALIGPLTSGPAEQFLQPLVFANRVILIGQSTAGAGGQTTSIPLSGRGRLVMTIRQPMWDDGVGFGKGFSPDNLITTTARNLSRGEDPALDAARKAVR